MRTSGLALFPLAALLACGGGTGIGEPLGNTVVGSWNLTSFNRHGVPSPFTVYGSTQQAILVSDHLTIAESGMMIETTTYAPNGSPTAGHIWIPSGTQWTQADTGTFMGGAVVPNASFSFPRSNRSGTMWADLGDNLHFAFDTNSFGYARTSP